jgi:thiol:disulfide interchange protein
MKRKLLVLKFLIFFSLPLSAQVYDPVTWDFGYEDKGAGKYELIFTATIGEHWHIYAMDLPDGGPIPTTISVDSIPGLKLDGKAYEVTKPVEVMDEAFGFKIKTFSDKAEFRQKIISDSSVLTVKGTVNFMACNNSTCSPPKDVEFEIKIKNASAAQAVIKPVENVIPTVPPAGSSGLLKFFLLSLLAGFAGVLTPCVFPMIPMTVAFFSRSTESRTKSVTQALIFGISIILIYLSLGIIVSLTSAGAGIANALSTHWIPNIIFFALFVIFAISFFGAFEIVLPNTWASNADSMVDKGGLMASFFMGLTTVIVSFSCTGPIIGALLVEAASGDVLRPTLGMLGFGTAFALPFTIFALFPSIMNRMPKSGGWLNAIKVVLGFVMLAFSMKFLVTIDSVYNLKLISRDLFLAIWIVLFSLMGLYLMGKIRFAHDSELKHIGTFRLFLIIVVFTFVVYLVPGLFGAPLKNLSSLLPPQTTTSLNIPGLISSGTPATSAAPAENKGSVLCSEPRYADIFEMPLGLHGYFDYQQGLQCAKEQKKPVLLDFKGHACANCKVMEAKVWSDPEVLKRLRENFVIVALYADDRTQLPENEWVKSAVNGKILKTIGKVNEDLEISKFKTNALPFYVITDPEGNPLNTPSATNLNVEEYKKWLDEGASKYR